MTRDTLVKLAKGAALAAAGAALTYLTHFVTGTDFGALTPAAVAAWSVAANALRKWLAAEQPAPADAPPATPPESEEPS